MPASQLKRLKASLREQGITGQQKSKKQKTAQRTRPTSEKIERSAALQRIRDSFNPFEIRQASRPAKFATVTAKNAANGGPAKYKEVLHRPGVSRSAGEEMRRATLLPEMQRRNKTGGLVDRRIGEGDVDMTPEEKAVQRFARAQQKKKSGASLFDLEASDDETGGFGLTHGGRSIRDLEADDFNDHVSDASNDDELLSRKRRRLSQEDDIAADEGAGPEHKKSRKEVMEEVVAKSKMYKYERQKTKEEDEDLREELDKGLPDILSLLYGGSSKSAPPVQQPQPASTNNGPVMNPDRQKLLDGMDRKKADKDYDARLRQLAQDTRAKPSERTKTEEEKAAYEAKRLKDLEEKRLKRMRGEDVSEDESAPEDKTAQAIDANGDEDFVDEAEAFGLNTSILPTVKEQNIVLDDEDDFDIDEDLIANDSEDDGVESDDSIASSDVDEEAPELEDEEDEFVADILGATGSNAAKFGTPKEAPRTAYTYPCPRSHKELLEVFAPVEVDELPTVVQRIRALYHPSLSATNKEAMADFSAALVDHIAYMGNQKQSLRVIEQLIRHLHSLSRTYPIQIAKAFRSRLSALHERWQPDAGDLIIFTAISSVYPTSDHFHQVVTPAMTLIARYLSFTAPANASAHSTGAYLVKVGIKYQQLSKRYIPEAVRFTYRTLTSTSNDAGQQAHHLSNLVSMAELWRDTSAFTQIFEPFLPVLTKLRARKELQTLRILLQAARLRSRPLELHHHRKVAIRTSLPKFEEGFNPDKHYDPDKERSEARKLQKEVKRERKGALRELRKDANFLAREQLREKKERDAAYDKKYKRLIAEIQGEEGHEAKEYEKEKKARKRARK